MASDAPDIFLSYAREDQATARRFAQGLEREGFSVWWDQSLAAGEAFDEVTERALVGARAVVVLWSPHSVHSRWVRAEAAEADENGTLVPVLIKPCAIPVKFKLTQTADLSHWQGDTSDRAWQSFVSGLRRSAYAGSSSAMPAPGAGPAAPARGGPPRHSRIALAAAGAVVLIGALVWLAFFAGERAEAPAATASAQQAAHKSIAVLPFVDLSPKGDQGYFADGVTEEILNSLARISNLEVTGRTSSFYYKGKNEDLKKIGETLGVEYLLEGSVRKDGEKLRITAQLIKAADGFHLWSQTYDRQLKDVFGIQEDVARTVANTLQVALGVGELGHQPGMTHNVEAYEDWLAARSLMRRLTIDGYLAAAAKLDAALHLDPMFEFAWMDAYYAHQNAAAFGVPGTEENRSEFEKSRQALSEGLKQNPDSDLLKDVANFEGAAAKGDWIALERAVAIPDDLAVRYRISSTAFRSRGNLDVAVDKSNEAIAELERRKAQDPLDVDVIVYLSEAYADAGRIKDALAEQDRGLALLPNNLLAMNSVITAYGTRDTAHIERNWQRARAIVSTAQIDESPYALRHDSAAVLASLRMAFQAQPRVLPASRIALWSAIFGDPQLALRALQADDDLGRRTVTALALWRPVMQDVRHLPGFKDLVRKWGLVDYWKQYGWGEHCKPVGADDFVCH
jgi:TolB-like protein